MYVTLGERGIGDERPCWMVAEIGSNHDGRLERALALIDLAAAAGADAVKFHSFRAATLVTRRCPQADGTWRAVDAFPVLDRLTLPSDWHPLLRDRAEARGVAFLSTPFDESRASLLAALGVPAFRVASGDLTHLALLRRLGGYGRPIVLSTARGTADEIDAALTAIADGAGTPSRRPPVVLLHSVYRHAGPAETANLRALQTMRLRHGTLVGWTDHAPGHALALGAVALGACVVEKHFTDDAGRDGPDHAVSLEPGAWRAMVDAVRELEAGFGDGVEGTRGDLADRAARRSVYAARPIAAGAVIEAADLKVVRPGLGLPPTAADALVGRQAQRAIAVDEPLRWEDCA